MTNLISLDDERKKRAPHVTGKAICIGCRHTWVAVAPVGTTWLDCPACSLPKGRFIEHCEIAAGSHWTCACGNDLFYIVTPSDIYCPNCGTPQRLTP